MGLRAPRSIDMRMRHMGRHHAARSATYPFWTAIQNSAPRAAIMTRRASPNNAATAPESIPFCSSTFRAKASAPPLALCSC